VDRVNEPAGRTGAASAAPGVWLGVDVGTVRVGVARSDRHQLLASPLITLARDVQSDRDLDQLAALVAESEAVGVVIGLPKTLANREGASAVMAREYAAALSSRIAPIPVTLCDERLTTATAQRRLSSRGVRGKAMRAVIDQAAAVVILQQWLDSRPPR
jgi:putative Holliday junction resolvase